MYPSTQAFEAWQWFILIWNTEEIIVVERLGPLIGHHLIDHVQFDFELSVNNETRPDECQLSLIWCHFLLLRSHLVFQVCWHFKYDKLTLERKVSAHWFLKATQERTDDFEPGNVPVSTNFVNRVHPGIFWSRVFRPCLCLMRSKSRFVFCGLALFCCWRLA